MRTKGTGTPAEERGTLPHMDLVNGKWKEASLTASPSLRASLKPHKPSYRYAGIIPPLPRLPSLELTAIADAGALISILPENKATSLGIELCKVSTKVMGATLESWLDIKRGPSSRSAIH